MAMESFFLNIEMHKSLNEAQIVDILKSSCIVEKYKTMRKQFIFKREVIYEHKFVIDENVLLEIDNITQTKAQLSLSACYANFIKNIGIVHKVLSLLSENGGFVVVLYGKIEKEVDSNLSMEYFIEWIKNLNEEKYTLFVKKYGEMYLDILPGIDFYEYMKDKKISF